MTVSSLEGSGYRYQVSLPQHNRTHDPPGGYIASLRLGQHQLATRQCYESCTVTEGRIFHGKAKTAVGNRFPSIVLELLLI